MNNAINIKEFKSEHCGFCNDYIGYTNTTDFHCNSKMDDIHKYLVYLHFNYYLNNLELSILIKHNFTIEKYDAYGSEEYTEDNYKCFSDIIEDTISSGVDFIIISGGSGIGKTTLLKIFIEEITYKSLNNNDIILPILFNFDNYSIDLDIKDWIYKTLEENFSKINFNILFTNRKIKKYFIFDTINSIQYKFHNKFKCFLRQFDMVICELKEKFPNVIIILSTTTTPLICSSNSIFKSHNLAKIFLETLNVKQVNRYIENSKLDSLKKKQLLYEIRENHDTHFFKLPFFLDKLVKQMQYSKNIGEFNKTVIVSYFFKLIFSNRLSIDMEDVLISISQLCYKSIISRKSMDSKSFYQCFKDDTDLILTVLENAGIIKKINENNEIEFSHQLFQDYFFAKCLYHNEYSKIDFSLEKFVTIYTEKSRNIEILTHLFNFVNNKEEFLIKLMKISVFYAGYCILAQPYDDCVQKLVVDEMINIIKSKADIDIKIELGFLLGKLGDIRLGTVINNSYIEPNSKIIKQLNLKVSIYPVTNREYSFFLNSKDYTNERYWKRALADGWNEKDKLLNSVLSHWLEVQGDLRTNKKLFISLMEKSRKDVKLCACLCYFKNMLEDAMKDMIKELYCKSIFKPLMWESYDYNNPSQPVIGICIYEALAYCEWLTFRTGRKFRLLTHEEWNIISYSNSYDYAFGEIVNKGDIINTGENGKIGIWPVGIISENCSLNGLFDLNGNIFEWVDTIYQIGEHNLDDQYICKGGSWLQNDSRALSRYVGRGKSWVKNIDLGFRICEVL